MSAFVAKSPFTPQSLSMTGGVWSPTCVSSRQEKAPFHWSSTSREGARNSSEDETALDNTKSPADGITRRKILAGAMHGICGGWIGACGSNYAAAVEGAENDATKRRTYFQRFPTLFDPLYGESTRETVKRQVTENIWTLEQNLVLGPLETPLRCVVVRLKDGTLWVHAPLAPTEEFYELVESCAAMEGDTHPVAHVVAPTYALEHKVFVKDALIRWPNAKLWTSPGQFSYPIGSISDDFIWGKNVNGVLDDSDESVSTSSIPWIDEIQYETLAAGTFFLAGSGRRTFYETVFYHKADKTLIVTDSVAQIPLMPPSLSHTDKLLLVSKRSTADNMPENTEEARQAGWEKTALLVSYFFPEHEELDPDSGFGVVTWTDGWHNNFRYLAGRLLVPPVVRTLLYAENPGEVRRWVERVVRRWDFERIIPAHWEAPIKATPGDFKKAFLFLEDNTIDAFPLKDVERGLKPIADIALGRLTERK